MACACRGRAKTQYLWYDPINAEGVKPILYNSEIEARAKTIRRPGTKYITYNPNVSIGAQIQAAETTAARAG